MSPPSVPPQAPPPGRPLPSTGSLQGRFPDFSGTIGRLRLLASPRASLRLLRSALPPPAPPFAPTGAGRAPRGPGPFLTAAPAPPLHGGEDETSQVPGRPLRTCPALRPPTGAPAPGPFGTGDGVFRHANGVDSAKMILSVLNHAACTLPVYASQPGSPPDCATLGSGWGPALAGQVSHLLGRIEGFRHVSPSTCLPPSPSFAWRNCMTSLPIYAFAAQNTRFSRQRAACGSISLPVRVSHTR